MAIYYCSHLGDGTTGTTWATAETTLTAALATATLAGDTIYIADDHTESTAGAVTLTGAGTATNPVKVLCADRGGTQPPVSADLIHTPSAIVANTTAANLTINGHLVIEGVIFQAGSSSDTASLFAAVTSGVQRLKNCALRLGNNSASSLIRLGNSGSTKTVLDNVTMQFGAVGQSFSCNGGVVHWRNTPTALTGSTFPTTFISVNALGHVRLDGVDLSALLSGKTLVGNVSTGLILELVNCKIEDDVTLHPTLTAGSGLDVKMVRTSETTNYKFGRFNIYGDETTETTIVRTGGSSDGTQAFAKKIVTTANAKFHTPFEALPIEIWNDVEDVSRTITVEGTWGDGSVPDNNEIWIEVEYLANAGDPNAGVVSSAMADLLATPAAYSSSAETWGGGTSEFKMTAAFTPAQKGPVLVRVKVGAASATFYVCGKASIANT